MRVLSLFAIGAFVMSVACVAPEEVPPGCAAAPTATLNLNYFAGDTVRILDDVQANIPPLFQVTSCDAQLDELRQLSAEDSGMFQVSADILAQGELSSFSPIAINVTVSPLASSVPIKPMVENVTGSQCPPCGFFHEPQYEQIKDMIPHDVTMVKYHTHAGGYGGTFNDPWAEFLDFGTAGDTRPARDTTFSDSRSSTLRVTGVPTFAFNGQVYSPSQNADPSNEPGRDSALNLVENFNETGDFAISIHANGDDFNGLINARIVVNNVSSSSQTVLLNWIVMQEWDENFPGTVLWDNYNVQEVHHIMRYGLRNEYQSSVSLLPGYNVVLDEEIDISDLHWFNEWSDEAFDKNLQIVAWIETQDNPNDFPTILQSETGTVYLSPNQFGSSSR